MVFNLYLKVSELQLSVLTEFMSLQEIIDSPEEELLQFLSGKTRNRIVDMSQISELLKKAVRDSYRLYK